MIALLSAWLGAGESDGMSADELARFNALPATVAREELLECCQSPAWADRMASGRPYSSARDAVRQSNAIIDMLAAAELEAALAGHRPVTDEPGPGDGEIDRALAASNLEYERRFGHIYLVSAAGRSSEVLLAIARRRLRNPPETEWRVVRMELQKINEIRLRTLLAGAA
jgi:2-oxo-4-hydroxy-4-carboxy-5-ureidoimidazoline decarboxylase